MKKDKIAVIAGNGELPKKVINKLKKDNKEFIVISLLGAVNINDYADYENYSFYPGQMKKILSKLKECKVNKVVLAGGLKRPSIFDVRLDSLSYKILAKAVMQGLGDDALLRLIMKEIDKVGATVVGAHEICPSLTMNKGVLGKVKPSKKDSSNIDRGIKVLQATADLDIGQSIVIDEGVVIGIEAVEGTEELIKRCGKHKLSEKGGVLVKMKKSSQSDKVDMPTIGVKTIEQVYEAGFSGIAIESGNVLVINQDELIKKANELKIFIKAF
jgi:DUF1009 family protein